MSAPDYAPKRSRRIFLRRSGRPYMLQISRRGAVNSLLAVIRLLLRTVTRSRSAELPCHWLEGYTEIIYIGQEGISLYFNQSSNFWRRIEQGPVVWRDFDNPLMLSNAVRRQLLLVIVRYALAIGRYAQCALFNAIARRRAAADRTQQKSAPKTAQACPSSHQCGLHHPAN